MNVNRLRPFTPIEMQLVRRMVEIILTDLEASFQPLSPVRFLIDRIETNPRFATITRPANAAILIGLKLDMEGRGGTLQIVEHSVELLVPSDAIPDYVEASVANLDIGSSIHLSDIALPNGAKATSTENVTLVTVSGVKEEEAAPAAEGTAAA